MTGELVYDSDFAENGMGLWAPQRGSWSVEGGMLVGTTAETEKGPGFPRVALPLEQQGPMTLEVQWKPMGRKSALFFLMMFASHPEGHDALNANLRVNGYTIRSARSGMRSGTIPEALRVPEPVWRVAWHPEEEYGILWYGDHEVGRHEMRGKPEAGSHIVIFSLRPVGIQRLRVYAGIVGPAGLEADAIEEQAVLVLANGDKVPVSDLRIQEGQVSVQITGAEASFDLENLARVIMPLKGRESVAIAADAAMVHTAHGRIVLSGIRMGEQNLTGTSPSMGEVRMPAEAVQKISWNQADWPVLKEKESSE
jgi:hypothetical protein